MITVVRILFVSIVLLSCGVAEAKDQSTIRDAAGNIIGRTTTDVNGNTVYRDPVGRIIAVERKVDNGKAQGGFIRR
jgi:hypothetical protein